MNKIINALTAMVSVIYSECFEGKMKYFTSLVILWFAGLILTDLATSLAYTVAYTVLLIVALSILKVVFENENDRTTTSIDH